MPHECEISPPAMFMMVKTKCFTEQGERKCKKKAHSCWRKVAAHHLSPAKPCWKSLGRAALGALDFVQLSCDVGSMATVTQKLHASMVKLVAPRACCEICGKKRAHSVTVETFDAGQAFEACDRDLMMRGWACIAELLGQRFVRPVVCVKKAARLETQVLRAADAKTLSPKLWHRFTCLEIQRALFSQSCLNKVLLGDVVFEMEGIPTGGSMSSVGLSLALTPAEKEHRTNEEREKRVQILRFVDDALVLSTAWCEECVRKYMTHLHGSLFEPTADTGPLGGKIWLDLEIVNVAGGIGLNSKFPNLDFIFGTSAVRDRSALSPWFGVMSCKFSQLRAYVLQKQLRAQTYQMPQAQVAAVLLSIVVELCMLQYPVSLIRAVLFSLSGSSGLVIAQSVFATAQKQAAKAIAPAMGKGGYGKGKSQSSGWSSQPWGQRSSWHSDRRPSRPSRSQSSSESSRRERKGRNESRRKEEERGDRKSSKHSEEKKDKKSTSRRDASRSPARFSPGYQAYKEQQEKAQKDLEREAMSKSIAKMLEVKFDEVSKANQPQEELRDAPAEFWAWSPTKHTTRRWSEQDWGTPAPWQQTAWQQGASPPSSSWQSQSPAAFPPMPTFVQQSPPAFPPQPVAAQSPPAFLPQPVAAPRAAPEPAESTAAVVKQLLATLVPGLGFAGLAGPAAQIAQPGQAGGQVLLPVVEQAGPAQQGQQAAPQGPDQGVLDRGLAALRAAPAVKPFPAERLAALNELLHPYEIVAENTECTLAKKVLEKEARAHDRVSSRLAAWLAQHAPEGTKVPRLLGPKAQLTIDLMSRA